MTLDPTSFPLVHPLATAEVAVEHHHYAGDLPFDLYRPAGPGPTPVVVLVTGLPDPGVTQMLGKPIKDWASYQGWARLLAASGLAAVLYQNRTVGDVTELVHHVRAHAGELGVDAARLALWACSGHAPTALTLLAREPIAAAALLYGYTLDLDGATHVADAAKKFYFAVAPIGLADLPRDVPIYLLRADQDATPNLNEALDRFVARAGDLQLTVAHHDGPHAFDMKEDTPASHASIDAVVAFLRRALGA